MSDPLPAPSSSTHIQAAFKVLRFVNHFGARLKPREHHKNSSCSKPCLQSIAAIANSGIHDELRGFNASASRSSDSRHLRETYPQKAERCAWQDIPPKQVYLSRLKRAEEIERTARKVTSALRLSDTLTRVAADNQLLLQRKDYSDLSHLHWFEFPRQLSQVERALSVLSAQSEFDPEKSSLLSIRPPSHSIWPSDEYPYNLYLDRNTVANLQHLLLCLQSSLVLALSRKLAEIIRRHLHNADPQKRRHKFGLGSEIWCSEFSRNQRPLNTTWPWSIKPSLAVLWGVCWMFYPHSGHLQDPTGMADVIEDLTQDQYLGMFATLTQTHNHIQDQLAAQLGQVWGNPGDSDYLRYGQTAIGQMDQGSGQPPAHTGSYHMARPSDARFPGGGGGGGATENPEPETQPPGIHGINIEPPSPSSLHHRQAAARQAPYISNAYASVPNSPELQFSPGHRATASGRHPDFQNSWAPRLSEQRNANSRRSNQQTYAPAQRDSPLTPQRTTHGVPGITVTVFGSDSNASSHTAPYQSPIEPFYASNFSSPSNFNSHLSRASGYSHHVNPYQPFPQNQMITPPADHSIMHGDEQENKRRKLSHPSEDHQPMQRDPSPFHRQPSPFLEPAPFQEAMMQHDDQLPLELQQSPPEYATNRESKTHKRDVDIPMNAEGKMVCTHQPPFKECATLTFERRCEWGKHMDKHERPYKCQELGCEKLQGFTYSGGLLRHQREVHKAGGMREPLFCDVPGCKRGSGNGFTRKENLAEHKRRVHQRSSADSALGVSEPTLEETLQNTIRSLAHPLDTPQHTHEPEAEAVVSPGTPTADHFIEPSLRSTSTGKRKHNDRDVYTRNLLDENRRLREMLADRDRRIAAVEAANAERDRKQAMMEQALKNAGLFEEDRRLLHSAAEQYIPNGSAA